MFNTRDALTAFYSKLEGPGMNCKPLSAATIIGMRLAMNHPEYVQAFLVSFVEQVPEGAESFAILAESFVKDNPIEMEV